MALKSESREVSGFTAIVLRGDGIINIEQTGAPSDAEKLVIEADEAILPRLSSKVRDGRLILGLDLDWWEWFTWWIDWIFIPNKSVKYHVTVKDFSGVTISGSGKVIGRPLRGDQCKIKIRGSGKIKFEDLQANSLDTSISGSGDIELSGAVQQHTINISGSGKVKSTGFETNETTLKISGSGKALVNVSETLRVRISGSGDVRYIGQPNITKAISGSGRVREL